MLFSALLTGPPMKIDLHIYRPKDLKRDGLAKIIQQPGRRVPKNSVWSTDTAGAAAARPASTTQGPDVSGSSCGAASSQRWAPPVDQVHDARLQELWATTVS
jgi:hypothetical protein